MKSKSYVCIILFVLLLLSNNVISQVLDVPQKYQEKNQWCWAATSQAVLEYYNTLKTQTEIVQYGTKGENIWNWLYGSSSDPTRRGVDLILNYFGDISSQRYSIYLALETVQDEIGNSRPIPLRWEWDGGGGHILLINGISDSLVYLIDPFYGPTINSYNWLLKGSSHTWTHSLKLLTTPTLVYGTLDNLPKTTSLLQNYPNPFNSYTIICFNCTVSNFVTLKVYDLLGKEIETLINGHILAGEYKVKWTAKGISSGIYFYKLQADEYTETRKLILQK